MAQLQCCFGHCAGGCVVTARTPRTGFTPARHNCQTQRRRTGPSTRKTLMRILMPIDGSARSKAALAFISSRSTLIESQPDVELLECPRSTRFRCAWRAPQAGNWCSITMSPRTNKIIKPALAALKKAGLPAQVKSVVGSPGVEVGRIAAEDAADLIVMGSHGHTGFKSLLFGSVTQAAPASCNTPLLVLRSDAAREKGFLEAWHRARRQQVRACGGALRSAETPCAFRRGTSAHADPRGAGFVEPARAGLIRRCASTRVQVGAGGRNAARRFRASAGACAQTAARHDAASHRSSAQGQQPGRCDRRVCDEEQTRHPCDRFVRRRRIALNGARIGRHPRRGQMS